jgi:hypothetical protein
MSRAATSVFYYAFVFIMGGLGLLLVPQIVLPLLGFSFAGELYARLLGMVMLILAYYYIRAARSELAEFFGWTVHARIAGLGFYIVFSLLRLAPPIVLVFGAMDLLGALWTSWAINSSRMQRSKEL